MEKHIPPQILRIKRKRGQDPLQALILEDNQSVKRSKPSSPASSIVLDKNSNKNFYFTLTRTDDSTAVNDESVIESILSEATPTVGTNDIASNEYSSKADSNNTRKRKFIIPKRQTEEDTYIPNELADMVSSLLTSNGNTASPKRKRRTRNDTNNIESTPSEHETNTEILSSTEIQEEKSEYVYDVYQLSSTEPMTTANHPQSQIGYIRFFDEENELYQSDDENDKTDKLVSDDEDSNAESFYQNDYPSDEDAGAYSDTYTEEEIEIIQIQSNQIDNADEAFEYINSHNGETDEGFEDLYEDFYDGDDIVNFLPDDHNRDEEEFERNHFFEGEEEDELAIHRDKIFGKLQKMINERN